MSSSLFRHAVFETSVAKPVNLPPASAASPEIAFAGRSNAGKSSAINRITDHRGLARVSKAPGRTRLINFFAIDTAAGIRLVDLPGYGYARVARSVRAEWDEMVGNYLQDRQALRGVVLIMDCRHPLTDYDQALLTFCAENTLPVHVLLSKSDKLGKNERLATLRQVRAQLAKLSAGASAQLFSALSGEGIEEAQATVAAWLGIANPGDKKNPGTKG